MPTAGMETILVLDDEAMVLNMASAMLTRYGYAVLPYSKGREALTILARQPDLKVDLAVIDVVMQDMAGPEVARELRYLRPALPVLFMTGFPDQHQILTAQRLPVLYKPFTSVSLIRRIRDILDRPKATAAGQ
jgi:two-component system cell cycle sensor histidine kinase/response regulator CckA